MRFDPESGRVAAGVRGDSGFVSIDGRAVLGPSAQFGGWLDHRIVCQFYGAGEPPKIVAYPGGEVLADRGANVLRAGGGVWAARLDGYGLFSSTDFGGPDLYLADVGPDGAIAYTPHAGFPIRVRERNGDDWLLSGTPAQVRLMGQRRASLYINSPAVSTVVAVGIPHPVDLPTKFYGFVAIQHAAEWWCAYQDEADGGRVVIRRHVDGARGWVRPAPLAFGIDLCGIAGGLRIGYARAEGEQPGDLVIEDIPIDSPMVALTSTPPVPIPVPVPPPIPEPPPMSNEPVSPNLRSVVARVAAENSHLLTRENNTYDNNGRFVMLLIPELNKADPAGEWGLLSKSAGEGGFDIPGTSLRAAYDVVCSRPRNEQWDVIGFGGAASHPDGPQGPGVPAWDFIDKSKYRPSNVWLALPGGAIPIPPTPGTPPVPVPVPTRPELKPILDQAAALVGAIANLPPCPPAPDCPPCPLPHGGGVTLPVESEPELQGLVESWRLAWNQGTQRILPPSVVAVLLYRLYHEGASRDELVADARARGQAA